MARSLLHGYEWEDVEEFEADLCNEEFEAECEAELEAAEQEWDEDESE